MPTVAKVLEGGSVTLGAQNCHYEAKGAFTGEVSVPMLAELGCGFVIVGHSERRHTFGENDWLVQKKAQALQAAGLRPIICVGETLVEREKGKAEAVVATQLAGSLPESPQSLIVAYEPVWAIGTGKTASPQDAETMHAAIQAEVAKLRPGVPLVILYGGSANAGNAKDLLATPGVDGLLVGGASLKADEFLTIARAAPDVA
jgi:triosephosphate isomerase